MRRCLGKERGITEKAGASYDIHRKIQCSIEFHKWAERLPEKDWFKISDVMAQVYKKYEDPFTLDLLSAVYRELARRHTITYTKGGTANDSTD